MTTLKRVAPASAFRVGLLVYAFVGFLLGAFCTLMTVLGARVMPFHLQIGGLNLGYFAVIFCPIVYGIMGGIGAAIAAFIYNLAAEWVGGLQVDIT